MLGQWLQRRVDLLITVGLLGVGSLGAASVVHTYRSRPAPRPDEQPIVVPNWRPLADSGERMGPAAAPVTIVELSDFQCPFCSRAAAALRIVRRRHGDSIAVVFRHFPLIGIHPFARAAAVASECAGEQGAFEAYHDLLFGNQDSIGIWSWTDVARRAGVRDTARFSACRGAVPADARVARDMAVGQMLHVAATPTIIVQGLLLPGAPTVETLDSLTRLVLAGRTLTAPSVAGASRK